MFTGIVTDIGRVRQIEPRGDTRIVIETGYDVSGIDIGASIACSGCCLTVTDKGSSHDRWFAVMVSAETLSKTNLGSWKQGSLVNLERPLRLGDELGGHLVTGHVDGLARLLSMTPDGASMRLRLQVPEELLRFIAAKGSVALDGVSLTVNEVEGTSFGVNIISHTQQVTNFSRIQVGMDLNLEVDLLARYVGRLVKA